MLDTLAVLDAEIIRLLRLPFLPPGPALREAPRASPLFRAHHAYAGAFQTIVTHFRAFRVQIDGGHLLSRARSLPALYESWCYLEVMRILKSLLTMCGAGGEDSPFRRLDAQRDRFVWSASRRFSSARARNAAASPACATYLATSTAISKRNAPTVCSAPNRK